MSMFLPRSPSRIAALVSFSQAESSLMQSLTLSDFRPVPPEEEM